MSGQWGRRWGHLWIRSARRHLRANYISWCLLAAIGLGAALRMRLLSLPLERDEGEYAYIAQLMLEGIAPYDLAYTMKLPGVSVIYAGMMLLFGQTHAGIHFGLLLINAITGLLIFEMGRRLVGPLAGVGAAAFFAVSSPLLAVQGLWANAEHFVLPFALTGVLCFLHWLSDRRYRFLIASGVLLGCGILMKQHGAVFFMFVILSLIWELYIERTDGHTDEQTDRRVSPIKALTSVVAGALLPIAFMLLVVRAAGSLDNFMLWTIEYAMDYATGNTLERGWFNFSLKGGALWQQAWGIGLLAAAGPFCLDWSRNRRAASARLCLFAALSFLSVCPGLFFRPHYFILFLPAAALLAGASLDRCYRQLTQFSNNRIARALPALLALAVVGHTVFANREYLIQSTPDQVLRTTYGMNPFSDAFEIGRWLRENSTIDDTIAVLGSEPQIFFYAQRRSATGYLYTYPLMEDQPRALDMQREMVREIEAAAPRYLVYVHNLFSWANTNKSETLILDWFWEYQEQYRLVGWSEATKKASFVRWGRPRHWPPKSPGWITIYRRIGASRPRR